MIEAHRGTLKKLLDRAQEHGMLSPTRDASAEPHRRTFPHSPDDSPLGCTCQNNIWCMRQHTRVMHRFCILQEKSCLQMGRRLCSRAEGEPA